MMDYSNPNSPWFPPGYDPYKGMDDDDRLKAGCLQVTAIVFAVLLALAACALFGSCTTTKYVPVERHVTDTLRITQYQRDSIYMHDSIHVSERGDTVRIERWRTQYRDRWHTDTVYQSRTDSVPVPYPVEKEMPAQLTWWQQTRLHLANILLWLAGIVGVGWMLRKYVKTRTGL